MLRRLALRHPFAARKTNPQIQFHGIDPLTLLPSSQKENRWTTFTPPAAGLSRRYRGRFLHRRSQKKAKKGELPEKEFAFHTGNVAPARGIMMRERK
jgi:hypothetical protein